jgi:hypothetical protein
VIVACGVAVVAIIVMAAVSWSEVKRAEREVRNIERRAGQDIERMIYGGNDE